MAALLLLALSAVTLSSAVSIPSSPTLSYLANSEETHLPQSVFYPPPLSPDQEFIMDGHQGYAEWPAPLDFNGDGQEDSIVYGNLNDQLIENVTPEKNDVLDEIKDPDSFSRGSDAASGSPWDSTLDVNPFSGKNEEHIQEQMPFGQHDASSSKADSFNPETIETSHSSYSAPAAFDDQLTGDSTILSDPADSSKLPTTGSPHSPFDLEGPIDGFSAGAGANPDKATLSTEPELNLIRDSNMSQFVPSYKVPVDLSQMVPNRPLAPTVDSLVIKPASIIDLSASAIFHKPDMTVAPYNSKAVDDEVPGITQKFFMYKRLGPFGWDISLGSSFDIVRPDSTFLRRIPTHSFAADWSDWKQFHHSVTLRSATDKAPLGHVRSDKGRGNGPYIGHIWHVNDEGRNVTATIWKHKLFQRVPSYTYTDEDGTEYIIKAAGPLRRAYYIWKDKVLCGKTRRHFWRAMNMVRNKWTVTYNADLLPEPLAIILAGVVDRNLNTDSPFMTSDFYLGMPGNFARVASLL